MAEVEIKKENLVYTKPALITDNVMHYCPGCSHGTVHKLVAEVIEEMGLAEKTVGISPVGCSVFAYNYIDIDWIEAAHGRALAVATAVKRLYPQNMVFTYQGDGDLSAIGTAESIHAAARGETYVKNKVLACEKCGFKSTLIRYEEDVTEEELLRCVDKLNQDDDVDGFIVQLHPLSGDP